MKVLLTIFLVILTLSGCRKSDKDIVEAEKDMPYFNQVNTAFKTDEIQCLLDQWYANKYKNEGIVLAVINDTQTYESFFSCGANVTLPSIDFTSRSLIIGMKADFGERVNSPVNISNISQHLLKKDSDSYTLHVIVRGKPGAEQNGGEWFAFTSLVPKIQGTVDLDISYVFN
jgi:hypothetical protein